MYARLAAVLGLAILPAVALAQQVTPAASAVTVRPTGAIALPGITGSTPLQSFNQISVNPFLQLGAISNRTARRVDIFDTLTNRVVGQTAAVFAGPGTNGLPTSGPDGAVVIGRELWAGDYPTTVRVFDLGESLSHPPEIADINTGGTLRAGSLDYDPFDYILAVANNNVGEAFVSLIDTRTKTIRQRLVFDGANGTPDAHVGGTGGILYDHRLNRFVISITSLGTDATKGAVVLVEPRTGAITKTILGLDGCMPSTMAEGPGAEVLVGCDPGFPAPDPVVFAPRTYIINAQAGRITADIREVGGEDFVAYNVSDGRYYTASRDYFTSPTATTTTPVLGVIDARTHRWLENVATGFNSHSVAVDAFTNQIYVPLLNPNPLCNGLPGCVAVFQSRGDHDQ